MGLPSVTANASSTVALWPGGIASAWTYHERLRPVCGVAAGKLLAVTVVGGLAGSLLLLWTPSAAFDAILPWLLLLATLALALARRVGARLARVAAGHGWAVLASQFGLGIYGGYFGGAVGLMMVALWCVLGESEVKALNGPRTMLVVAANSIAVLAFILAGAVQWTLTLAMLAGGLLGGVSGARLGLLVPARVTRAVTLAWTAGMTVVFFVRAYG